MSHQHVLRLRRRNCPHSGRGCERPRAVAAAIRDRQPLRYAGYVYDAHSQTYYLSQRHYDPATMRFLSKDPARADGEESAYQYCAGDPVGNIDPTGLKKVSGWPMDGQRGFTQGGRTCFYYAMKAMLYQRGKGAIGISTLQKQFRNTIDRRSSRVHNRDSLSKNYRLNSTWTGTPSFTTVKQEVNANRPLIAVGRVVGSAKLTHAWGVTGYEENPRRVYVWSWGQTKLLNWHNLSSTSGATFTGSSKFTWADGKSWHGFSHR